MTSFMATSMVSGSVFSCTTQLDATVHDIWSMVDEGCDVQAVVLDCFKTFDKVLHARLLFKFANIGIDHCSIRWIETFLMGRTLQVLLQGSKSERVAVTSGVSQRFALMPVMFLRFVNDMFGAVHFSTLRPFADDSLLYLPVGCENNGLF